MLKRIVLGLYIGGRGWRLQVWRVEVTGVGVGGLERKGFRGTGCTHECELESVAPNIRHVC